MVGNSLATTAVTFDELAQMVAAELDRSRASTAPARKMLLDLIGELRAAQDASTSADLLLTNAGWRLARITVQGFGGIGNSAVPLEIDFPTGDGLTVIRGDNGSGKTSLVSALETALSVSRPVTGGLWSAEQISDGAAEGAVEVQLVRDAHALALLGQCSQDGDPVVTARLCGSDGDRSVKLGGAWTDALGAANACFGYAALQNRLQKSADLQSYLEELLLLGPTWQLVHTELDQRAAESKAAKKEINDLRSAAQRAERELTERFAADRRRPVPPPDIDWGSAASVEPDTWLDANQLLGDSSAISAQVADDHELRAAQLVHDVDEAWKALDDSERELDRPELAPVLDQLQHLVEHDGLDGSHCPLCGESTLWRDTARQVLVRVGGRAQRVGEVRTAVSSLAGWVEHELTPLLDVGINGGPVDAVQAFRAEVRRDGVGPRPMLRQAVTQLGATLAEGSHTAWLARLRAASDASADWAAARKALVGPFVARWRERGDLAAAAHGWTTAATTLKNLQTAERQRRQDSLTARLRDAVDRLLPDAGITIQEITHKGGAKKNWGVELRLTIGDRPATLGMLSSGQRNALLLASLLCVGPPAPFGFMVVDDPVHALDDLRVDRFAQELTALADDRQVVVLTHDARLEENLRVRNPSMHLRTLRRDPTTATVTHAMVESPWGQLLAQAHTILATSAKDGWTDDVPVPQVVGGLCRHAVDGAMRHAVAAHAVRHHASVAAAVTALDKTGPTKQRFQHLLGLAGGTGSLPHTDRCLADHLDRWNDASHGGSVAPRDLSVEIKDGRRACKELMAWTG